MTRTDEEIIKQTKELLDFYLNAYIKNTARLVILMKMVENKEPDNVIHSYIMEIKDEMEIYDG